VCGGVKFFMGRDPPRLGLGLAWGELRLIFVVWGFFYSPFFADNLFFGYEFSIYFFMLNTIYI